MKADFKSDFSKTQTGIQKTQEREIEDESFLKQNPFYLGKLVNDNHYFSQF